MIKQIKNLL